MPIFLGSQKVGLYLGSQKIDKAYLGGTLVYQGNIPYATGMEIHYDGILNAGSTHDASATNWIDLSGNGNNAVATFAGSDGWISNGASISTAGSYFRVNKELFSRPFTIEFAVKISSAHNYGTLARGVSNSGIRDIWIGSSGRVMVRVQSSYDGPTKVITANEMHTIAITFTGNTQRVYIDGAYYSTPSKSWSSGASSQWNLFGDPSGTRFLKGIAYAMRWYPRILTDDEILGNYTIDASRFNA